MSTGWGFGTLRGISGRPAMPLRWLEAFTWCSHRWSGRRPARPTRGSRPGGPHGHVVPCNPDDKR
jgi:hypothetical protein